MKKKYVIVLCSIVICIVLICTYIFLKSFYITTGNSSIQNYEQVGNSTVADESNSNINYDTTFKKN